MPDIRLYSAKACPFAHRTRLVLTHKEVLFELIEIDLQNKPTWYGDVSLYGKVPALQHDGQRFVESAIINEYLEEVFPRPALLPRAASERARARILVDYANTRFVQAYGELLRERDLEAQPKARRALLESLSFLEQSLSTAEGAGPFWGGSAPGLVDFALYPWFERWPALDHYRNAAISAEHERLRRWLAAMTALPAVEKTKNASEYYIERYARYAGAQSTAA